MPVFINVPPGGGPCIPGQQDVPDSLLGKLICGTWAPGNPSGWTHVADRWPYAATALAVAVAVWAGWRWLRQAEWARWTRDATFLEIIPPVGVSAQQTKQLWLLLVNALPAPRRFTLHPQRLVFEVHADADRMRLGIYVPGDLNPLSVRRIIGRAWRNARISEATPPVLPSLPVRGRVASLRQPDWLPFTDERDVDADNLHPVFDALAAAGRGGAGLLQVIVCRAPSRRAKVFGLAGRDPVKAARKRRGAAAVLDWVSAGLRMLLRGGFDLVQSGASTRSKSSPEARSPLADPFDSERAKLARLKGAQKPHLLVGVQVFAAGEDAKAATAGVLDIAGGFPSVSTQLRWRRMWRPAVRAATRWIGEDAMVLSTLSETAALAGLPAEPSLYGLPAASSRHRPGTSDTFRTSSRTSGQELKNQSPSTDSGDDDLDPWGLA